MPKGKKIVNRVLAPGVMEHSQSELLRMRRHKVAKKGKLAGQKAAAAAGKPVVKTSYYPADDIVRPLKRNFRPKTAKLRSNITPGTVLILLAGRFRGKRVIFLEQLPSGLLLVTGPFKVNGVPLRRVNQAYVIATSTKVNVAGVSVPAAAKSDAFFAPTKAEKAARHAAARKGEGAFFAAEEVTSKVEVPAEKKAVQEAVDAQILKLKEFKDKDFDAYIGSKFSLRNGDKPHAMKF